MTQVVIIGFDGMDADLLRVYGPSLPNLRRLMLESPFLELKSSFPPEPAPAWGCVYTGLNPANHGLLCIPCEDEDLDSLQPSTLSCGTTFWDLAGGSGRRVCVLNPYLAYPAWPLNGIMLSLSPRDGSVSITPVDYDPGLPFPTLPPLPATLNSQQLKEFYHTLVTRTLQQASLALELLSREPWDLFFLQLNALDYIQHLFWRYSDLSDPGYPGRGEHVTRIHSFYRLCDQIVGDIRNAMSPEGVLVIVSAYGHGRRGSQRLNLNEWLREQGLLVAQTRGARLLDRYYLAGHARARSLGLLAHFGLQEISTQRTLHREELLPTRGPGYAIDEQNSLARVACLTGDGPFGGIMLNQRAIERQGRRYAELRQHLLTELSHLRSRGRPLLRRACAREEVYQGKYLHLFPDILFELQSDFAVSESLYVPLLTTHPARRLISGTHRLDGVFLIGNLAHQNVILQEEAEISVLDVAPTILSLLGIHDISCDGKTLLSPRAVEPSR